MTMPTTPLDHSHRASVSSVATFMTDCSADAVIPSSLDNSRTQRYRPRISCPVSISEDDYNDIWSEPDSDILSVYLSGKYL